MLFFDLVFFLGWCSSPACRASSLWATGSLWGPLGLSLGVSGSSWLTYQHRSHMEEPKAHRHTHILNQVEKVQKTPQSKP